MPSTSVYIFSYTVQYLYFCKYRVLLPLQIKCDWSVSLQHFNLTVFIEHFFFFKRTPIVTQIISDGPLRRHDVTCLLTRHLVTLVTLFTAAVAPYIVLWWRYHSWWGRRKPEEYWGRGGDVNAFPLRVFPPPLCTTTTGLYNRTGHIWQGSDVVSHMCAREKLPWNLRCPHPPFFTSSPTRKFSELPSNQKINTWHHSAKLSFGSLHKVI